MKLIILLTILVIEILFRPRLDFARKGKIILWYGYKYRKYVILWNMPNVNE